MLHLEELIVHTNGVTELISPGICFGLNIIVQRNDGTDCISTRGDMLT